MVRDSWISFVLYPESLPGAVTQPRRDLLSPSQGARRLGEGRLEKHAWLVVACETRPHTIEESLKSCAGPCPGWRMAVLCSG